MILIIILCIVLFFKYYFKESFICAWDWKIRRAEEERNEAKAEFEALERNLSSSLQNVKQKQDEVNNSNSSLENSLLVASNKYEKILAENTKLTEQLNKATIDHNNCKSFNSLKLNAIKKIYS
jgi:predicted  nucleic acid-binding Zn-ribbon protein